MRRQDREILAGRRALSALPSLARSSALGLALIVPIVSIVTIVSIVSSASPARAGSIEDFDSDLVPFEFDNCSVVANGPNQASNQSDCDGNGYGNACDADYDQDGVVTAADFGGFLGAFGSIFPPQIQDCRDHDEDSAIQSVPHRTLEPRFPPFGAAAKRSLKPITELKNRRSVRSFWSDPAGGTAPSGGQCSSIHSSPTPRREKEHGS